MSQRNEDNSSFLTDNVISGCPIMYPESKLTRINELCERNSKKV